MDKEEDAEIVPGISTEDNGVDLYRIAKIGKHEAHNVNFLLCTRRILKGSSAALKELVSIIHSLRVLDGAYLKSHKDLK